MKKKTLLLFIALLTLIIFTACSHSSNQGNEQEKNDGTTLLDKDFEQILEEAKGTTVTFYGWGGDPKINGWIDEFLAENMKKEYDITVKRVGMNIDEILNILLNEKQLEVKEGNIDVIWINGENFFTAMENDLLFGPITNKLPNFIKYVDTESLDVQYDFGYPVNGYEAPYGKAQFVLEYNSEKIGNPPKNTAELLELAKNHPGKITYPAPPDFTGSAFVRNVIYDIVGYEPFMDMEAEEEVVREAIKPAIDYLKELKPYLWKEGKTYPAEAPLLDNMFADGEVWMTMNYNPFRASGNIEIGIFPESTRTFIFEKGSIGNTHFLAIPFNAPNKEGAFAFINYILSVDSQATKYEPATWGDLPVLDNDKLTDEEKERLNSIDTGIASLPQEVLLENRLPEMPAHLVPIIEKIWLEEIPGQGE